MEDIEAEVTLKPTKYVEQGEVQEEIIIPKKKKSKLIIEEAAEEMTLQLKPDITEEELIEEAVILRPKLKLKPQMTEDIEAEVTLKSKRPKPITTDQEDVDASVSLPKKPKAKKVIQDEASELSITQEEVKLLT